MGEQVLREAADRKTPAAAGGPKPPGAPRHDKPKGTPEAPAKSKAPAGLHGGAEADVHPGEDVLTPLRRKAKQDLLNASGDGRLASSVGRVTDADGNSPKAMTSASPEADADAQETGAD